MAIDTVKLKSPHLDEVLLRSIEHTCGVRRQAVRLSTGAIQYEITTGELDGSWDSRISLRPMRQEWRCGTHGRPKLETSEPYVIVECSLSKAFNGQNVFGGPCVFTDACARLVDLLEELLSVELPPASGWLVRRVDVAESYRLRFPAIQDFFSYIHTIQFPRRRAMKFGDHAVYFPGSTTTVKLYHKGSEFAEHDHARVKRFFTQLRAQTHPGPRTSTPEPDGSSARSQPCNGWPTTGCGLKSKFTPTNSTPTSATRRSFRRSATPISKGCMTASSPGSCEKVSRVWTRCASTTPWPTASGQSTGMLLGTAFTGSGSS